jgi:hypothetical protein
MRRSLQGDEGAAIGDSDLRLHDLRRARDDRRRD